VLLNSSGILPKSPLGLETGPIFKGQVMANRVEKEESGAKSAARAQKQEARAQRQAARSQKAAEGGRTGRPEKLCSFSTVEVRKGEEGYQVIINSAERRYKFTIAPDEVGPILKDLETAIHVIRGQH
jgi:hypothetical protein